MSLRFIELADDFFRLRELYEKVTLALRRDVESTLPVSCGADIVLTVIGEVSRLPIVESLGRGTRESDAG
jgi:hypothetical protein